MRDPIILFFCLLAAALALLIWRLCRLARDLRRDCLLYTSDAADE